MQDSDKKVLIGFGIFAGLGISAISITAYLIKKKQIDADVKKVELESQYPPEYWKAKEAEAKADADVKKAKIEAEERLKIDARKRAEEENARQRAFEKDAPAEYWEQKRIAEEEKTKRELNARRYQAEINAANLHSQAMQSGIKAAERAIKNNMPTF